jgi:hypothetical protein
LRSGRRHCLSPVKGEYGIFLGLKGVKQGDQAGHLQDFVNDRGELAQLQIATGAARAGQQPHQHTQSAAVDESHLAQMQCDVAAITQKVVDVQVQYLSLTRGDAPATADDGDLPDFSCVQ